MGFKMPIEIEVYITLYLYMSKLVDLGTVYLTKFLEKRANPIMGLALLLRGMQDNTKLSVEIAARRAVS